MSEVEIEAVETLSEGWRPLRQYRLRQMRKDGRRQSLVREVYAMGPAAAVLPHDPHRGTVLLIRQFRLPALLSGDGPRLVEACAGLVENGKDAATTIREEAEQELGCGLDALREVMVVYSSPGVVAEKVHLFTAVYDPSRRHGPGGGLPEEGEEIEVLELPLAEAWAMVERREIMDAKTVLLLQHLKLQGCTNGPDP
ncbi:NUDIX domain-containing protein [Roseicella aerolata]|uniref:GDP-mannose pyrophosphatase n=1 Tax=Roseicella aerolata TaxID=2883479 RepID=A0A9X1LBK4_9PROT|nr:NUDIX domain-containing protein [Roseicella aerolata]MCB4823238.1 NUDIX domain-containing protein [Roseicella aerolata]